MINRIAFNIQDMDSILFCEKLYYVDMMLRKYLYVMFVQYKYKYTL